MGRIFQLMNMVDLREQDADIAALKPAARQDQIDKLANGSNLVGIYSPAAFHVNYRGEVIEIKEGWHEYAPGFAVWALGKYGKGSKYGRTWYTGDDGKMVNTPVILDEAPGDAPVAAVKTRERKSKAPEAEAE